MRRISLTQIIKNQIKKEIRKIHKAEAISQKTAEESSAVHLKTDDLMNSRMEQTILPMISILFDRRLLSGGNPVKISHPSLKVYIGHLLASFGEENIFEMVGQEVTLTTYTEDRWVYVYLNSDKTFTINKYAPHIGSNTNRISICKVWVETGASNYDVGTIRDLRQVGVASGAVNHILRQQFLYLMHAIPATVIDSISVVGYTYSSGDEPSGGSGLYVKVGSTGDKLFYSKLNPIPDTIIELSSPINSGDTYNYYIVASAQVDTDDPDDFKWNIKAIEDTEDLEIYEIPIAIVKGLTIDTIEIIDSMIETIGYQRTKDDYFNYELEYKKSGAISEGEIDLPQLAQFQGKIHRVLVYLGTFSCDDSGGLDSGDTASLDFDVEIDGITGFSFSINYDENNESDIVKDVLVADLLESSEDAKVKSKDVVKIKMTENFPSGNSFTYNNLVIKLLASKMYY